MASRAQRYRNAFLIYNPRAGKLNRRGGQLLQRIIAELEHGGHRVTPLPTPGPYAAAGMASEAIARGADLVLACGGDGTVNEVLNGVAGSEVALGAIPAGTANVLAHEMRLPSDPERAAAALSDWVPRRVATGVLRNELNPAGRYFLLMAGAGLDARVIYELNGALKARIGKGAYWVAGFRQFGRKFPLMDVRLADRKVSCSFALASRVRNYGGDLSIARKASLLQDDFEVVLFEGEQSWVYLRHFMGVLTGRLDRMNGVVLARARELDLLCSTDPRVYIQVDGEFAGRLPARVEIAPAALTLLTPTGFVA